MSKSRFLTLIVPEIGFALAQAIAERSARWPQLARLAGRGSISHMQCPHTDGSGLSAWQVALLDSLGIGGAAQCYPSAAVTRTGDTGERANGFWMHALPIHFAAGLDHLAAILLQGAGRVSGEERAQLEPAIVAHLKEAGLDVVAVSTGEWLAHSDRNIEATTAAPQAAVSKPLEEVMPKGRDAAQLQRLMTELQMVLHEHPVNVHRLQRGLPQINAVWFHGAGAIASVQPRSLPQAFGGNLYLRGVYRLHGLSVETTPIDANALLSRMSSRAVAVISEDDLDALETSWFGPLARALAAGTLVRLDLVLDRWHVETRRSELFRFWRAERAPSQWVAC